MSLTKPDKTPVEPLADPFRVALKRVGQGHTKGYQLLKAGKLRTFKVGSRRYMTRAAQAEFIATLEAEEAAAAGKAA